MHVLEGWTWRGGDCLTTRCGNGSSQRRLTNARWLGAPPKVEIPDPVEREQGAFQASDFISRKQTARAFWRGNVAVVERQVARSELGLGRYAGSQDRTIRGRGRGGEGMARLARINRHRVEPRRIAGGVKIGRTAEVRPVDDARRSVVNAHADCGFSYQAQPAGEPAAAALRSERR